MPSSLWLRSDRRAGACSRRDQHHPYQVVMISLYYVRLCGLFGMRYFAVLFSSLLRADVALVGWAHRRKACRGTKEPRRNRNAEPPQLGLARANRQAADCHVMADYARSAGDKPMGDDVIPPFGPRPLRLASSCRFVRLLASSCLVLPRPASSHGSRAFSSPPFPTGHVVVHPDSLHS
jgi:hypothetical protein